MGTNLKENVGLWFGGALAGPATLDKLTGLEFWLGPEGPGYPGWQVVDVACDVDASRDARTVLLSCEGCDTEKAA
jgi:hypothetical protein